MAKMNTLENHALKENHVAKQRKWTKTLIDSERITINISGQQFVTTRSTLLKFPNTVLGELARDDNSTSGSYFFESDATIFQEILKFYKTEELHCPKGTCLSDFQDQLEFWEIETKYISNCCSEQLELNQDLEIQFMFFDRRVQTTKLGLCYSKSYDIWSFLTDPYGPNTKWRTWSKLWMIFYLLLTLLSGISLSVSTLTSVTQTNSSNQTDSDNGRLGDMMTRGRRSAVQTCNEYHMSLDAEPMSHLMYMNFALAMFYAVEIWTRFICCPDKTYFWKSVNALDLSISVLECMACAYLIYVRASVLSDSDIKSTSRADRNCMAASRLELTVLMLGQLRFYRLVSYASVYSGLRVLLIALYRSWREILLLVILLAITVLTCGPLVYYASVVYYSENNQIVNLPVAYWFVVLTMLGYGDFQPGTALGNMTATFVMLIGLTVTALPIAIVGGNFSVVYEYNLARKKRLQQQEQQKKLKLSDGRKANMVKVRSFTIAGSEA